jgi:ElaB/YqjD/DUF883 family membrane-anchored ribosome-binding protein
MDEAQRIDTEYGRTTPDGSYGREGDKGSEPTKLVDKAKEQLEPGMDKAKQQLEGGLDKAKDQVDAGMDKAAVGLESTAERIKGMTGEGDGMPAQAGTKLAEGMESAATYLKEHSSDEIFKDLEVFVKEHPTQALVGAVFAGFLFGRMMR